MRPVIIFSPPRHRGDLLVRILNRTPGMRCAGDAHNFLQRLRKLHGYRGALFRDQPGDFSSEGGGASFQRYLHHSTEDGWDRSIRTMLPAVCEPQPDDVAFGMRDVISLTGEWNHDASFLSWLQFVAPDAKLVFLKRDQMEVEISLAMTHDLWAPHYGKCAGSILKRVQAVWQVMDRYHEINPESTVIMNAGELLKYESLEARLLQLELPVSREAWEAEIERKPGNAKEIAARVRPVQVEVGEGGRLPLPPESPIIPGIEVHTLRYGTEEWIKDCGRSLDDWCARHGYPVRVWDTWDPSYPSSKFCEVDMLRSFLDGDSEWLLYVDGDVYVHPISPPIAPELSGFHIMPDYPGKWARNWPGWVQSNFPGQVTRGWTYRNAGVWICDREAAAAMLQVIALPYIASMMEQDHWNLWLCQAHANGMPVHDLDPVWNRFTSVDSRQAWFYHLAGRGNRKNERLADLRNRGLIPAKPEGFLELPEPDEPRAIVYPWKSGAAAWEELRYSLRSIQQYFEDKECPILLMGDKKPDWLRDDGRVIFWETPRYADALTRGLQAAKEILWMNDDIYLRRPCGWDDFRSGLYFSEDLMKRVGVLRNCSNSWRRGLGRVALDSHHYGADAVPNFSTHTPYRYEYGRAMKVLRKFGVFHKMPFETAYWNFHPDLPRKPMTRERDELVMNHSNRTLSEGRKAEIQSMCPVPADWEI